MLLPMSTQLRQLCGKCDHAQADNLNNQCIHQLIELQAESSPDRIAVIFADAQNTTSCRVEQKITYQELNNRANQLAHYLQSLHVKPEILVGICMKRSPLLIIGLLAILKAGGSYVPLDPAYPQERLALMLEDSQLPILLTEQSQLEYLPPHQAQVVCLDTDWEKIAQYCEDNPTSQVIPDNLAYTIYTSGSTGKPKGVQILHRGVVNFLKSMREVPGLSHEDILVAVTTISFDIAVLELYLPLIVGACVVLVSKEVTSNAELLLQVLRLSNATVMQATPATWRMLLTAGWEGNPKLKILCGGEAISRDLANQLLQRSTSVWNMYGPTETTVWSAVYQVESGDTPVPIGQAIANTQIYLAEPHQNFHNDSIKLVPAGEPGELLIGGAGLARGYLNRPELTQTKFIPDPFSEDPEARLYRTGDLARYRSDGNIEYIGRIDHQVKVRGYRIELGEIEAVLSQHPLVREVVVTVREDVAGHKRLVAYIVPESGMQKLLEQNTDILQLRTFLSKQLPEYMVPAAFVAITNLPLTPNGKVDRRALPAIFKQTRPDIETEFVAPRTPLEEKLAQMWIQILGIEEVGVHDNFFELGGNSLLCTQLLSQIRTKLQLKLPLLSLFEVPTIAGIAVAIANAGNINSTSTPNTVSIADLQVDAVLDPTITPAVPLIKSHKEPQRIFITGATGFVGAFLLHELLQKTQASIYCLVRATSLEQAKQKLYQNLKNYLLADENLDRRVIPVIGDLSQPLLGLSQQEFHELANSIDLIYHNGAFVNLIYPYPALRAANVHGTKEILKLATQIKVKPVHFISTLDVFQSPQYAGMQEILETDDLLDPKGLSDGYAQSKWVAEKLVKTAIARGIPACIYRLGTIIGHSQTGASQTNDLVARLVKGLIQLGYAPELDVKMSLTPVDYVSQAIIHLSQQEASWGKAFHLVSPDALPFYEFVNQIQGFGYSIEWTNYQHWQAQLLNITTKQEHALSPVLFLFTDGDSSNQASYLKTAALVSQAFDCQNTLAGLAGTNIVCPAVDSKLIQTYFSYLIYR
ncbi:MAG: phenylalanine racemase [Hapalosiphonaceae cyanobacterium JJU2]|nr:MAG: phenylalanine racemase [Hapalosiphonaceae cyanobacterium JJU2]